MPNSVPPIAGHSWIPTPTIGNGGDYNYLCQKCRAKITKSNLINDEVAPTCVRVQRKVVAA